MAGRKKGGHGGGGGGHDGAGGLRWLLTYADLITLLLIMFVVLYSMSKIDAAKFKDLAQMLRAAFGGVLKQGPTFLQGSGDQIIADLVPRLRAAVEGPAGLEGGKVFRNERGVVVRLMTDNVLFDSGATTIRGEMKSVLDAIAPALKEAGRPVMVEGHTDDLPIRGGPGRYPSNWELSTARATAVVRYLVESGGVPPAMLSAAGYAEFHPVVPNSSSRARARNRRIDIIVLEGVAPAPAADAPARPAVNPAAATPPVPAMPPALPPAPPALPPAPPLPVSSFSPVAGAV